MTRLGVSIPSRPPPSARVAAVQASAQSEGAIPMHVLYGSNGGTAEAFAQRIAGDAPSYGKFYISIPLNSSVALT
jgi:cytochrome P450 / NADPH-cytochrome P450 reductase